MVPQATLRVQARQMKALDRIANSLEVIATLLADRPAQPTKLIPVPTPPVGGELVPAQNFSIPLSEEPEADTPGSDLPPEAGPATEIADAGTPRARRRRGAVD
jgi:hypothetical protein